MLKSIYESKIPRVSSQGFFVSDSQLAKDDNLAGLQAPGSLFDSELHLLAIFQVLESSSWIAEKWTKTFAPDTTLMDLHMCFTTKLSKIEEALYGMKYLMSSHGSPS
jgi:hypothetical protein